MRAHFLKHVLRTLEVADRQVLIIKDTLLMICDLSVELFNQPVDVSFTIGSAAIDIHKNWI